MRAAAAAKVRRTPPAPPPPTVPVAPAAPAPVITSSPRLERALHSPPENPRRVIVLAASTGGTEALREVLVQLPGNLPPIVIVQHIPAAFSRAFADRLDSQCVLNVREAGPDEMCQPGEAIIAPGNHHLLLQRTSRGYRTQLNDGPQVWHQRPAADVLFRSIRGPDRPHVIGGVFTGMGKCRLWHAQGGLDKWRSRAPSLVAKNRLSLGKTRGHSRAPSGPCSRPISPAARRS